MPETLQSALETYWRSKGLEMKPEVSFRLQKNNKTNYFQLLSTRSSTTQNFEFDIPG